MASKQFEFRVPRVVIAGYGALARLAPETRALGGRKALVVTDPGVAKSGVLEKVTKPLAAEGIAFEVFDQVQPEPPIACAEAALAALKKSGADFVIGVGGGSSMDVAKVVAMLAVNGGEARQYFGEGKVPKRGLPTVLIPTTAGTGSEVSPIAMLTDPAERLKKGIVSWNILADVAVVDPEMSRTTPPRVTAATGMDALTHAIEGMFSVMANPVCDGICLESAHLIATYLPRAFKNPDDMEAREGMAVASMMAGMVLGNSSVTIVHALAYPLGARYNVPHGVANSVMLVSVMEFNKDVCRLALERLAEAMGANPSADIAIETVRRLSREVGMNIPLRELGVTADALHDMAVDTSKISRLMAKNPKRATVEDLEAMYRAVF
jgi:alcohol dehydrogenase class IV